ncbi:hypothetical protein ADK47_05660 [Streptomyces rimosus subsp. rimosus]|nr:hypothetical protein ADK78_29850 [Kitasatospora aureofaciens]KOT44358.1 hypothetical protein ADK42_05645 [Streptomyces rimosus subsp. rimosus]KOT45172.1 hypothetical protein ADK84_05405 [Streptomyces sp. NRRL WC-3701]KOT59629.1 hypothetical protein ADK45_21835 [Streptomyces rimosus subsp. rimosus]KOT65761.1 hypothetical protein ADK44_06955 [Streptomyces rimosus subsp. rimosus]
MGPVRGGSSAWYRQPCGGVAVVVPRVGAAVLPGRWPRRPAPPRQRPDAVRNEPRDPPGGRPEARAVSAQVPAGRRT